MAPKKSKGGKGKNSGKNSKKGETKAAAPAPAPAQEKPKSGDVYDFEIPEGYKGGEVVKFTAESGKSVGIILPKGAKPGQIIKITCGGEEGKNAAGYPTLDGDELFLPGMKVKDIGKGLNIDATPEDCLGYAIQCMKESKWTEANVFSRASLAKDPENSKAWFQLGCACFMEQDQQGAMAALSKANDRCKPDQTAPTQFEILLNLGCAAHMSNNNLKVAIFAFQKAHELQPDHRACKGHLERVKKELELQKDGIISVRVPEGARAGQLIKIKLPNGETVPCKLPPGVKAGQSLQIKQRPKKEEVKIFVPEGFSGGDVVSVPNPHSKEIQLKLPANAKAGDTIELKIGGKDCGDLLIGTRIIVQGLKKLKGQQGTLVSFDEDKKKWTVAMDSGTEEVIKPFHLVEMEGSPELQVDASGEVFILVPQGASEGDVICIGTGQEGDESQDVVVPKGAKPGDKILVKNKGEVVMNKMRQDAKKRLEDGASSALPWLDKILAEGAAQANDLANTTTAAMAPQPPTK